MRRGYFIEGLGAAQFAAPATVDLLRSTADNLSVPASPQGFGASAYTPQRTDTEQVYGTFTVTLLAATDPANPYGAALSWPAIPSFAHEGAGTVKHRPARKAGACVVLVDGAPVLYVERGAKTLLAFTTDPVLLEAAAPPGAPGVCRWCGEDFGGEGQRCGAFGHPHAEHIRTGRSHWRSYGAPCGGTACGTADAGFLRDGPGVVAAPCHLAKHNLKLNLRLNNSFNLNLSSIMPHTLVKGVRGIMFPYSRSGWCSRSPPRRMRRGGGITARMSTSPLPWST